MPSAIPYSLALVGLVLTVSLSVLGSPTDDPCLLPQSCRMCVVTKINATTPPETNSTGTCVWETTSHGEECRSHLNPSEGTTGYVVRVEKCPADPPTPPTTAPPPTPPPSNTTTTTTSTTPAPTTNATTTIPTTTPAPSTTTNGTTTTTLAPPTNGTTTSTPSPSTSTPPPKPTPAPAKGGFSWASFIGGIVFAAALSSVAYLIWRFYKVRLDRNYHTFANPTF